MRCFPFYSCFLLLLSTTTGFISRRLSLLHVSVYACAWLRKGALLLMLQISRATLCVFAFVCCYCFYLYKLQPYSECAVFAFSYVHCVPAYPFPLYLLLMLMPLPVSMQFFGVELLNKLTVSPSFFCCCLLSMFIGIFLLFCCYCCCCCWFFAITPSIIAYKRVCC